MNWTGGDTNPHVLTTASFVLFHFACAARADFCLSTTGVVVVAAAAAAAAAAANAGMGAAVGLPRPSMYPFPAAQYSYPMLSPEMAQMASW